MPDVRDRRRHPRTLMEQLVWQREKTYDEQVAEFETIARRMKESASMSTLHLQRLAAGEKVADRATPSARRVMREMYGHSLDDLLGPPGWQLTAAVEPERHDEDPHDLTAGAARVLSSGQNSAKALSMGDAYPDNMLWDGGDSDSRRLGRGRPRASRTRPHQYSSGRSHRPQHGRPRSIRPRVSLGRDRLARIRNPPRDARPSHTRCLH